MPIHPGILLSSLLVVVCLGVNVALYPEVREMLHGPEDTAMQAAASKAGKLERPKETPKTSYPELERPEAKSVPVKKPETEPAAKPSKVNRPIPVPVDEEKKPKTEKPVPEKKPEEKKSAPKEEPKVEPAKSVAEKPVETKKEVEKKTIEEKKPEPEPVKKEEPKPVEAKKGDEPKSKDESYGLPSVFPLAESPEPKEESSPKDAAEAFRPLVPAELEKEYREAEGRGINQASLPPMRTLPALRQPVIPQQTAPQYGAPYPGKTADPMTPVRPLPTVESAPGIPAPQASPPPVEVKRPERKPPKRVWDTAETILERPIVYE